MRRGGSIKKTQLLEAHETEGSWGGGEDSLGVHLREDVYHSSLKNAWKCCQQQGLRVWDRVC